MKEPGMQEIARYRADLEVVRDTAAQVIKDFGLFNIDIRFSGNEATAYDELKSQVYPELLSLYEKNYSKLQSLFYRIDIPEKKFRALPSSNKEELIAGLTELVLERELVKVITRKLFSSGKNNQGAE
jgi:hypothetical protein